MMQKLNHLRESPSQTAGPYVHIGCTPNVCGIHGVYDTDLGSCMVGTETKGERITVTGCVFDGTGTPLKDALIEIWQADADGVYAHGDPRGPGDAHFTGWGRAAADGTSGTWAFETIKPGPAPFPDGRMMAAHITFWIVARGINIGLHTRMYFPSDPMLADDPWLTRIEHQTRVRTLIAKEKTPSTFEFNIHLQGPDETIFFDV